MDDSLDFLKQSDIMLDSLEGLIVQFDSEKEEENIKTDIEVFEALIKRHAHQLLQLEVVGLNYSNWQINLTSLPMLRSLSLTDLHPSVALDLLAGCRQSIRKLKIDDTTFCDSTPEFDYDTLTATTFKVDGLNDLDISIEEHMMCRFVTDNSETLQSLVLKSKYWGEDMMQSLRLPHLTHLWIKVGMTPILLKCNMNIGNCFTL